MSSLRIIGAGMAGLLAARMLQDRHPVVIEQAPSLPNNHKALLRFRSDVVANVTNIPFKKVSVVKAIHGSVNPVADMIAYSLKVTGQMKARSVIDIRPTERWIAPDDFIPRLASSASIDYGNGIIDKSYFADKKPTISTIPMPDLMDLLEWEGKRPDFMWTEGWSARGELNPYFESTVYATVYFPDDIIPWYRGSITGSHMILEGVGSAEGIQNDITSAEAQDWIMDPFGLGCLLMEDIMPSPMRVSPAKYQKISELNFADREITKQFMMWATKEHSVYSLGRFATWRPKVLIDDLVHDVQVIAKLIDGNTPYFT
jgi:hypothetical protein